MDMDILVGLLKVWLAIGGLLAMIFLCDLLVFFSGQDSWFFEECQREKRRKRRKSK